MKLYALEDHQRKSLCFQEALADADYVVARHMNVQHIRFLLSDADWRDDLMNTATLMDLPVFLYPHAARPMVIYDGCVKPRPVTCMFTQAPGGAYLMKKIGYPYPVEVTGWGFSELRPFKPVERVRKIMFAPIHPNGNGYLHQVDKDLNRRTLERLVEYCKANDVELTVRYIGTLEQCGIPELGQICEEMPELFEAHKGKKNNTTFDMESSDVVVSHQTFAYMSVALGKPTVMIGEDVPPRSGNREDGFKYVEHWASYKDYLMFPLDILQSDTAETIAKACEGSREVADWRERLIGEPFDGPRFVKTLESYL